MSPSQLRQYELILLGASGYTGKLCAEYIAKNLPTDLKWAVAGRSSSKLSSLIHELKSYHQDRAQPEVEIATLSTEDLDILTRSTTLLINTIGPYHLYSSPVVEACAKNGTHYLDVTGESPWVLEMIERYHATAEKTGAIIIPEIGIESAPSDMLTWSLATFFREKFSLGTEEIIGSLHRINGRPSGGTMATVLTIQDTYGLKGIAKATRPWAMSSIHGPKPVKKTSFLTKLFGVRTVPGLGVLTTSIAGATNRAIVQRSWSLLDQGKYYGSRFQYNEYATVRNAVVGAMVHFALIFGAVALSFRPFRYLVQKLVYAPGEGDSKENTRNEAIEWRALARADENSASPKRAFGRFRWDGGHYYLTGLLLAEAAMVILRDRKAGNAYTGGVLTPATLGQPFVDRMREAGVILQVGLTSEQ
ncbi:MAG: hypothetical protein Q9191_007481 [Dirinaria sp. TL-2023a]